MDGKTHSMGRLARRTAGVALQIGTGHHRSAAKLPMRKCRYCHCLFRPLQKDQKFCREAHRKAYWRYGSMSLEKIERQIEKRLGKSLISPLLKRMEAIELRINGMGVATSYPLDE